MFKLVEWLKREWMPVCGMVLASVGSFIATNRGMNAYVAMLGALAVIALLALCVKRPKATPYVVVSFAIFDRDLHLGQPFQLTTLTVILLLFAPWFMKLTFKTKVIPRFAQIGTAMIAVGLFTAAVAAPHPELAWPGLLRWMSVLIMIGGVAALCATQPAMLRHLGLAVLAGGTVSGLFGLLQRSGHYWLVGPPYVADVTDSTFGYYTNFASYEAVAAVVGFGAILNEFRAQPRRPPLFLFAGTSICLYMVVSSYSRGALVLTFVGLLVILMKQSIRPARFLSAIGGLALISWVVVQSAPEYVSELVAKFTYSQNGDIVRSQLQAGGYELLLTTPLGIGFNNFSSFVASGEVYSTIALAHAHNTFIQMGLDAGWLGGIGFLLLVSLALWAAFRSQRGMISLSFGAALAGSLVQAAQDYFFFETASLVVFGLVLAGALGGVRQPERESRDAGARLGDSAARPASLI